MSYVKMSWAVPLDKYVLPMLKGLPEDLQAYIADELDDITDEIESWMRENAPWEDRTGDARASLKAEVEVAMTHIVRMKMGYENIPYSQYLESMQGGRFSILIPTMDYWFPILVERVQRSLRGYTPRNRRLVSRRVR